jgi:hypothetical protein
MDSPPEKRRFFWPIALLLHGTILAAGGMSYISVSALVVGRGTYDLEALYALGSVGVLVACMPALAIQRRRGGWPFEALEDPYAPEPLANRTAALIVASLAAGLGTGLYAGLLNDYTVGGLHLATALALFFLAPAALLGGPWESEGPKLTCRSS